MLEFVHLDLKPPHHRLAPLPSIAVAAAAVTVVTVVVVVVLLVLRVEEAIWVKFAHPGLCVYKQLGQERQRDSLTAPPG